MILLHAQGVEAGTEVVGDRLCVGWICMVRPVSKKIPGLGTERLVKNSTLGGAVGKIPR